MVKEFNQASRKLFSALCPVTECKEGKPSNNYLELKIYESYFNLLDNFAEFKTQFDAINNGHKAWHSEFEINGVKYTIKALDNQTLHNFSDSNAGFSTVFLPEGYVKVETEDNVEWKSFAELHKELRQNTELLNKFDEACVKAKRKDITDEYFSDLRIIFANTLSPMHAAAKDEVAFNKMLGTIGTYHTEIINFVFETYKSPTGMSQLLEYQADIGLKELQAKKQARPETLEDVLEVSLLNRLASAAKKGLTTIPGMLVATAGAAVAAHSDSTDAGHSNEIASKSDLHKLTAIDNCWENTSAANTPAMPVGVFYGAAYMPNHDEVFLLKYCPGGSPGPKGFFETWVYHIDSNTWENKTTAQQPPKPDSTGANEIRAHDLNIVYDSKNDKVIFIESPFAWVNNGKFETWVYDCKTNNWANKTAGAEPGKDYAENFQVAYDTESGKVITYPRYDILTQNSTWTYDCTTNTWASKKLSIEPGRVSVDGLFYAPKEHKVLCMANDGQWVYDVGNNKWEKKSDLPSFVPHKNIPNYMRHRLSYDEQSDKVIALVEIDDPGLGTHFETWAYDFDKNNWSNMQSSAHPPARYDDLRLVYASKEDKIFDMIRQFDAKKLETWQYSLNASSKPPANSPSITLSLDETLMFVTPEKISSPQAGDNNNVIDNLKNFESQKSLFTAPDGKPILFNKKISATDYDYEIFFLYWTDNPSNIPLLCHQHDWEYIAYKYDKAGNLIDTILSNHLETRKAAAGAEIYVGQGCHEMTTNKSEMWNPIPNLPRHFKDGGQNFKQGDYYVVNLDSIIDSNSTDAYSRYKANEPTSWSFGGPNEQYFDALPADQKEIAKERAKVPWLQNIIQNPEQIFTQNAPKPIIAMFELEGKDADLEFRVIGNSVTGEDNGTIKSEIPTAGYTKVSSTKDVITLYTTEEQYNKYKVELHAKNDSSYKIKAYTESKGVLTVKEYSGILKAGENYVLGIEPQPQEHTDTNANNSMTWTLIGAAAAGTAAAASIGYILYNRRRRPPTPVTVPPTIPQEPNYQQDFSSYTTQQQSPQYQETKTN